MEFITTNYAPIMFAGLIVFLLLGTIGTDVMPIN